MNIRLLTTVFAALLLSLHAKAQINVSHNTGDGFPIAADGVAAPIYVSPREDMVVRKTAQLFADDVERVAGLRTEPIISDEVKGHQVIIVGTIGNNKLIDKLANRKLIDLSKIKNGWEQYVIQTVSHPQKGVDRALIVAGSDKRGAAYGLLSISELMGVSPYYWWADVPARQSSQIWISGSVSSERPSVKYRGLFINDEDWGLKSWASTNYEKQLGDIGPKTYARVCELILRLKGNMLAPAMHPNTGAFYSHPESKLVADSFGIVITTSHCEPLLVNTASKWEWDVKRDGDWNYKTNRKAIIDKWNKRLDEAGRYDNIYTMAMRGLHDSGLRGDLSLNERTQLLSQVINDQRQLLTRHLKKPIRQIPQIFVPYKETMDVYENGLHVPDDITLVWVDDNYGYMKRVSDPEEQKRSGGSGVYYHISYWGAPHDYIWLNTTPPVLMYEELMKAYNTGANRYWLLNVGDIKPGELGMKTFFDLAWNVGSTDINSVNKRQAEFLGCVFGSGYTSRFQSLLDNYYRLAWSRKPEYMGWEREYDTPERQKMHDTEYSFQNYSEAQQRLSDYQTIANEARSIMSELPKAMQPAFFQLVAYPMMASSQMNRKFLMAQLNHEQYQAGNKQAANWAARQAELSADSLSVLNRRYNSLLGGKWNGMMGFAVGSRALYMNMPSLNKTDGAGEDAVEIVAKKHTLTDCFVLDLAKPLKKVETGGHKMSIVEGLGYDWKVLQLGRPTDKPTAQISPDGDRMDYALPSINRDSVEITLYTVPFFPLYKGMATRIAVAVDGRNLQVADNKFQEYSQEWKDQVLRNAAACKLKFAIDPTRPSHTLSIICADPGMMVEKVIVDWGGLKPSYMGPSAR